MSGDTAELTEQQLHHELDLVERAIARSATFIRRVDTSGQTQVRVSPDLLALAEREHAVIEELRRRYPQGHQRPAKVLPAARRRGNRLGG